MLEPNNLISEAYDVNVIAAEESSLNLSGTVDLVSDVDLYRFELEEGQGITLDLDTVNVDRDNDVPNFDSYLRIFDGDGNELAFNDDYSLDSEEFSTDSFLGFIADRSGEYYVGVSSVINNSYNPLNGNNLSQFQDNFFPGDYELTFNIVDVIPDEDSDNTITEALTLDGELGEIAEIEGEIESDSDVDLFEFQLAAGEGIRLKIHAANNDSELDSYLRIFDSEGNQLGFDDNSLNNPGENPADTTTDSAIDFAPSTPGKYYVGVSSAGNFDYDPINGDTNLNFSPNTGISTGAYQLQSEILEVIPDTDDNNTISEAIASGVSSGGNRSKVIDGKIDLELDVDLFRVNVAEGDGIYVDLDAAVIDSNLNSYLRIFDSEGNQLTFDRNDDANITGEFSTDSAIAFAPETPGAYYIGVSDAGNFDYDPVNGRNNFSSNVASPFSTTGNYELQIDIVEIVPDEDPDNTIAEANATGLSSSGETSTIIGGALDSNADADLYQFQLDEGEGITFDINAASQDSDLDSYLRLFDSEGNQLAFDDDDDNNLTEDTTTDSFLNFVADTSGEYFIGVSSEGNTGYDAIAGRNNFSNDTGLSEGDYELALEISPVIPDEDPDNTISEAIDTEVSSTGQKSATIDDAIASNGDIDLYQFQLNQGDTVTLDIDAAESSTGLDSVLRLFDDSGVEIINNDDGTADGESSSTDSLIEYTAAADGTYYVGVSSFANFNYDPLNGSTNFSNDVGTSSGDYELTITIAEDL